MASAFVGQPANTEKDFLITKGLFRAYNIPDGALDPVKGFPLPFTRPANNHYQSRGPGLAIGVSFAILLVVLITGIRLMLRLSRRELRWGPDDWVIIPAVVSLSH